MLEMLKARKEELQAQGKKGFTLMEMLIVIAIIAILIAIAIPVMTNQLESARDATTCANLRSAYAQASIKVLDESQDVPGVTVTTAADGTKTAVVSNVDIESTNEDYGSGASDLPFTLTTTIAAPADNAKAKVTFTFPPNDAPSAVVSAS